LITLGVAVAAIGCSGGKTVDPAGSGNGASSGSGEGSGTSDSTDKAGTATRPTVETFSPLDKLSESADLRIVWIDPERSTEAKLFKQSDLVRFEYPGSKGEILWSNRLGTGGLDALVLPRPDLVYRIYRPVEQGGVPRVVGEVPVLGKEGPDFWRGRDRSMMPVPFFFVGRPSGENRKINLDSKHKDLSVAFLTSPYDWGVVLASSEALILIRTRLAWQREWVAVDLHVYNVYGPPLEAPPSVSVRMEGGEQLAQLPIDQADKIIPDNLTFGEFESGTHIHAAGTDVSGKPLGIGTGVSYTYSYGQESGTIKGYSKVHPLRWELIMKSWDASQLGEGSFRRGLVLFRCPQAKPVTKDSASTLILRTPSYNEFAHLDYKGCPSLDAEVGVPGSAVESMRYHHAIYGK
jgi:hypothetical protein